MKSTVSVVARHCACYNHFYYTFTFTLMWNYAITDKHDNRIVKGGRKG